MAPRDHQHNRDPYVNAARIVRDSTRGEPRWDWHERPGMMTAWPTSRHRLVPPPAEDESCPEIISGYAWKR